MTLETLPCELVYFLKSGPLVKIGTSADPARRRHEVWMKGCHDVDLLATMIGGKHLERTLHRRFAHLRSHGEWFRADAELLEFIRTSAVAWPGDAFKVAAAGLS